MRSITSAKLSAKCCLDDPFLSEVARLYDSSAALNKHWLSSVQGAGRKRGRGVCDFFFDARCLIDSFNFQVCWIRYIGVISQATCVCIVL